MYVFLFLISFAFANILSIIVIVSYLIISNVKNGLVSNKNLSKIFRVNMILGCDTRFLLDTWNK